MAPKPLPKLPFAPLREAMGMMHIDNCRGTFVVQGDNREVARRLGMSNRQINRWVADGIPVDRADDAAVLCAGLLPHEIWPEWADLRDYVGTI